MAGIGFRISALLKSEDIYEKIGGAIASVFLSCGPWLCTIVSIGLISLISSEKLDPTDQQIYKTIINYTYVGSLILFGFLDMVTTRYISDALYLHQEKVIPTLYAWLVVAIILMTSLLGLGFYSFTDLDWSTILLSVVLLSVVTAIWCAMIFLSACKDYFQITVCFLLGAIIAVGGAYSLDRNTDLGILGPLLGFTIGQVFVLLTLSYRVFREFGTGSLAPRDYFSHCGRQKIFILVGLLYSISIWIDKFVFWLSPNTGEKIAPLFYNSTAYESGIFLAYLFVVPSMSYFLVQMETKFYMGYRKYFTLIDHKAPLPLIEEGREKLTIILQETIRDMVVFQAFVTVPALLLAPHIVSAVQLPPIYATVFRYGLIASSLHVFFLFANILILYFDLPKIVLRNYFIFLLTNGLLSYATVSLDFRYHGLGYALAALVSLVISLLSLDHVMKHVHFYIFMKQPLTQPTHLPLELEQVDLK